LFETLIWHIFMSMKYRSLVATFFLLFSISQIGFAGDKNASHKAGVVIPEVALLDVLFEDSPNIQFQPSGAGIAGEQLGLKSDNNTSVWLNYSSIVAENQKRKVTATIIGEIPEGVTIKVQAHDGTGNGRGALGQSKGKVSLSNNPTDIIAGIGSCYTGKGIQNGFQLSYEVELDADRLYQNERIPSSTLNVVYTLTDDN